MIPIYGFMEGDSLGLLIFTYESDTVAEVARKLLVSARSRVSQTDPEKLSVYFNGRRIARHLTMREIGIKPLAKIEVRKSRLGTDDEK